MSNIYVKISDYLKENIKSVITYDGDIIIKKFNDKYELDNTIKYFPNNPNLFPKIFKINDNIVEMERLDTKKSISEFNKLNKWFKENLNISFGSYLMRKYTFKLIYPDREFPILPPNIPKEHLDIIKKYQKLINSIMLIVGKHFLLDVHSKNFGYDKSGNLKMFDI